MRYSIEEKTLTDMADAVRNKVVPGELVVQDTISLTTLTGFGFQLTSMAGNRFRITIKDVNFNGADVNKLQMQLRKPDGSYDDFAFYVGFEFPKVIEGYFSYIYFSVDGTARNYPIDFTYIFEAIDDDGKPHTLTPQEMIDKLNAAAPIPTDKDLVITGDCQYRFAYNGWNWIIKKYGDRITAKDINGVNAMFRNSNQLVEIPFELNFKSFPSIATSNMFDGCEALENVPKINNIQPNNLETVFNNCKRLREIPDDFCETWDWSYIDNNTSSYSCYTSNLFSNCYSLRKFPIDLISHINHYGTSMYSSLYNALFNRCYVLDEVNGIVVHKGTITSNFFNNGIVNYCYRLKNFTFAPYEGSVNWSNQTIDMGVSCKIGYTDSISYITAYNSGITADKEVKDDATYQALKDDPDWFATKIEYSRYNHDSAVNTINSLPTTTGTGCTIKFKGASGSLTDGGAINTLTEEEIAVAAAKGWTVTLA